MHSPYMRIMCLVVVTCVEYSFVSYFDSSMRSVTFIAYGARRNTRLERDRYFISRTVKWFVVSVETLHDFISLDFEKLP